MGFDVGRLLGDVLSGGGTYFKRRKKAKKKEKEARDLIAQNTELAQQLFDRDYGTSHWEDVQSDPALRAAQDQALARLEGLSREGFSDLDRQALDQSFRQSRREEQAQRGAAMDAAARRGDVSGGNALLGSLMAQQGGADRASDFATNVGLAGRDRALQALESYGQQAGQMRGQDFGEQSARAGGLDSFKQWATGQRSNDAAMLMNARGGQAQSLQQHAAQMQDSSNIEAVGQGILAGFTGGATAAGGAAAAGASGKPENAAWGSGTLGANAGTGGTPWIQDAGQPAPAGHWSEQYRKTGAPGQTQTQTQQTSAANYSNLKNPPQPQLGDSFREDIAALSGSLGSSPTQYITQNGDGTFGANSRDVLARMGRSAKGRRWNA